MDKQIFVQNIKKYCALRGIKPTIACAESGAGKDIINQLEKRGSIPSVERVQLLAQYLGVTVSELLGEPTPEGQTRAALTEPLAGDGKIVLSQTALLVASAYGKADEGTQAAVRKLLDVEAAPQESGHTSEAM